MTPRRFRVKWKDPVIQAVQFTGKNDVEVGEFVGALGRDPDTYYPCWEVLNMGVWEEARVGDWIVRPIMSTVANYQVLSPEVFDAQYAEVKDDPQREADSVR